MINNLEHFDEYGNFKDKHLEKACQLVSHRFSDWDDMLYEDGTVNDLLSVFVDFVVEETNQGNRLSLEAISDACDDIEVFVNNNLYSVHYYQTKDGSGEYHQIEMDGVKLDYGKFMIEFLDGEYFSWESSQEDYQNLSDDRKQYVGFVNMYQGDTYKKVFKSMLELHSLTEELFGGVE